MGYVIVIFGTLIAMNFGVGQWLSNGSTKADTHQGIVEIEHVDGQQVPGH